MNVHLQNMNNNLTDDEMKLKIAASRHHEKIRSWNFRAIAIISPQLVKSEVCPKT